MAVVHPAILLLSNKFDYSTDHVAYRLSQRNVPYLRLNRDMFGEMDISLELSPVRLSGKSSDVEFEVSAECLRSIYFRAPVFLRETFQPEISVDEQYARSQWAAFLRSLTVFSNARWLNHPRAIYQAEVKPFQLLAATKAGLKVPRTVVTNSEVRCRSTFGNRSFVAKTLDSVVLCDGNDEAFIYTSLVSPDDLSDQCLKSAPVIAQEALLPKTDIRVTVVGSRVFPVSITRADGGDCPIDWRLQKNDGLLYQRHSLPEDVGRACREVLSTLGLSFGGIDLVLQDDQYWFIEVNPTGEWSWLMEPTGYDIDQAIATWLAGGTNSAADAC